MGAWAEVWDRKKTTVQSVVSSRKAQGALHPLTMWESLLQTCWLQDVSTGAILSELTLINMQAHV